MRRMLLVGMTALLIGFATARGSGALAQSSDEEGVRAAVSAFYAALNARDIQAMEALWAPDANVIMIYPGAEWSVAVNDVPVRVSQGQAVVLATTPVHVKMRSSESASDFLALVTILYERRDGRWLIVHQHVSQPPR